MTVSGGSAPTIEIIRPGPLGLEWLRETVRRLQDGDPLRTLTLVAPNYYAGRFARWHLGRHGGTVNVRSLLMRELADRLSADEVTRTLLSTIREVSAVRRAVRESGGGLSALAQHPSTIQALLRLFRELRRSRIDTSGSTPTDGMTAEALEVYRAFRRYVMHYDDPRARRERATQRLRDGSVPPRLLAEIGALVVYLPTRIDPADRELLDALAVHLPITIGLSATARSDEAGSEHDASTPGEAADAYSDTHSVTVDVTPPLTDMYIVRAPDASEEVRTVVRRVVSELEQGVPLTSIAILYRQSDPYAGLVRDALQLANLPWAGLEGWSLRESRPARALMGLLRLPESGFTREAVLEWLDVLGQAPGLADISVSAWDRASRMANVARGAEQWYQRLSNLAAELTEDADRQERDGQDVRAERARSSSEQASRMAAFIRSLVQITTPPEQAMSWTRWVDWVENRRIQFATPEAGWNRPNATLAVAVERVLRRLREADDLDPHPPELALFLATLEDELRSESRRDNALGDGVVVGPVQSVTGLAFDRIYVLGVNEGTFPPPPSAEPFFSDHAADPLHRRARQRHWERQAFRTALASADGGQITLCTTEAAGGRAAFPSRWLLAEAARLSGVDTLHVSAFRAMRSDDNPWLEIIASAQQAVMNAAVAADQEDRRLHDVSRWRMRYSGLAGHALAQRSDLPLRTAIALSTAHASSDLTEFDGNASAAAVASRTLGRFFASSGAISATAIESWATCPYRFFLGHALRIEPTEQPEERWTIGPLERGTLIHAILEDFFNALRRDGRPGPDEPYVEADEQLLITIAEQRCAGLEKLGVTGHPLMWEAARSAILLDVRAFLREDERWRQTQHMTPRYFEQRFGDGAAWPAVECLVDGARLRFRGVIDRIDMSADDVRVHVMDYKTGSDTSYKDIEMDPVLAGHHVQLGLYTRAVRQALGDGRVVSGAFWFVSSKMEFRQRAVKADAEMDTRLDFVLGTIAGGIKGGSFPQVPGDEVERSFKNCQYCDFERVCHAERGNSWDRKSGDIICAPFIALEIES